MCVDDEDRPQAGGAVEALVAVATWLDSGGRTDHGLPLDSALLTRVTVAACRELGVAPQALDDLAPYEVEGVWRGARENAGRDPLSAEQIPTPDDTDGFTHRIVIVPDGDPELGTLDRRLGTGDPGPAIGDSGPGTGGAGLVAGDSEREGAESGLGTGEERCGARGSGSVESSVAHHLSDSTGAPAVWPVPVSDGAPSKTPTRPPSTDVDAAIPATQPSTPLTYVNGAMPPDLPSPSRARHQAARVERDVPLHTGVRPPLAASPDPAVAATRDRNGRPVSPSIDGAREVRPGVPHAAPLSMPTAASSPPRFRVVSGIVPPQDGPGVSLSAPTPDANVTFAPGAAIPLAPTRVAAPPRAAAMGSVEMPSPFAPPAPSVASPPRSRSFQDFADEFGDRLQAAASELGLLQER
jgi:hypothetical protein